MMPQLRGGNQTMYKYELDVTNNNLLGYDNDDDYEFDDEIEDMIPQ